MERVDTLLVAMSQFEPFLWTKEPPDDADTDAKWRADFPMFKDLAEAQTFSENEPTLYLFSALPDMKNVILAAKEESEDVNDIMNTTAEIIAVETIMMIARQAGIEAALPTGSKRRLPVAKIFIADNPITANIWFYFMFLERDFMKDAISDLKGVLLRGLEFGVDLRLEHEASSDVPWEETEKGKRENIDTLRTILSAVYATLFVHYRNEVLDTLQFIVVAQLYAGLSYPKTTAQGRPVFDIYVREYDDYQDAREAYEYYAAHGVEMANKLVFITKYVPEIGESESAALLAALYNVDLDQIEPGVWRFDPRMPLMNIWDAINILDGSPRPKLEWIHYPVPPPAPPPVPPPAPPPVAGYSLAEPFLSGNFDPTTFDPASEHPPIAIDLSIYEPRQYLLNPLEWTHEMGHEPEHLYIAATMLWWTDEGSPISMFEPIDTWKICFEGSTPGPNAVTPTRLNSKTMLRGKVANTSKLPSPGDFRLIRLQPVEGVSLL